MHVEQIDAPLVISFLNHLEAKRRNGASSRNVRLAAIKSFMHFLEFREPSAIAFIRRIVPMRSSLTSVALFQPAGASVRENTIFGIAFICAATSGIALVLDEAGLIVTGVRARGGSA
ncbi:MAG: site-specific integrase [Vicinamibacterales bacterium]